MRNIFDSLRAFFLLLAGLVILAHMTIPHDHHVSLSDGGSKDACPYSHERPVHHPIFPPHCHAFNDLPADKFHPIIIEKDHQASITTIMWFPDHIIPELHSSQTVHPESGKSFPDIFFADFSPLRAPPSLT